MQSPFAPAQPDPLPAKELNASRQIPPPASLPADTIWCNVRVRNISQQPATKVAVTLTAPAPAQLIAADGGAVSSATSGRMDFSPIEQVGPNEELIVAAGLSAADEHSNRLHVQVRDAQGGSNQDIQARWQVTIEPLDKP